MPEIDWDAYTDGKGRIDLAAIFRDLSTVRQGFLTPGQEAGLILIHRFENYSGGTGNTQIASLVLAQAMTLHESR